MNTFLSDPHSSRHEGCPYATSVVVFYLEFTSIHPASACSALGKGQFCWLMIPSQKVERKTENINLESYSQMLKETKRIHDPVQLQVHNKISKTMNRAGI